MLSKFLERFGATLPRFTALLDTADAASVDLNMAFAPPDEHSAPASSSSRRDVPTNRPDLLRDRAQPLDFLSREPVFSRHAGRVIGHELRLNNSGDLLSGNTSAMLRAMHDELLLKSVLSLNLARPMDDDLLFIRLASGVLDNALVEQLPPHNTVLAIQPEQDKHDTLTARCRDLRAHGFRFALDDFRHSRDLYPLLDIVDYLRFDIDLGIEELAKNLERLPVMEGITLIAMGVNDDETLGIATELAFGWCQGRRFDPQFAEKMAESA